MCSVRGQSHRLSLSLHYLRRLQGNTVFIAAHSVEGRGGVGVQGVSEHVAVCSLGVLQADNPEESQPNLRL